MKRTKKTSTSTGFNKDSEYKKAVLPFLSRLKKEAKKKEAQKSSLMTRADQWKTFLAVILLILGCCGFYFFKQTNLLFSQPNLVLAYVSPLLGSVLFLLILFYWCSFGSSLIRYIKESTVEAKKVVWPDRKSASRMTLMVLFFVFVLGLCMWIFDTVIVTVLNWIMLR